MDYATINGFTYVETLDDKILSNYPDTLLLNKKPTSEALLFRLLLGTINLKQSTEEDFIIQSLTYTKIREVFDDSKAENPISDWIKDFGVEDLGNYFSMNKKNKLLFDELLTEFSFFFVYKSKENHVSAFLHLYRSLEYMSYSFPMIFSSKTSNFYSSFDTFKAFFITKEQGQLKFFQEFIKVLFENYTLRCRIKIDTFVGDEILDKTKRKIIKKLCNDFISHDDGSIVSIEYMNLLDFMINLRNRYFHFQSDRSDNISNINFDSELFFSALNDKFANWLSIIYLEILIHGVYKYNLVPIK